MNLMFMNRLEKRVGDNELICGKVYVSEEDSAYKLVWQEGSGEHEEKIWYEGEDFGLLLSTLSTRLQEQLAEGYVPILDPLFDLKLEESGKSRYALMHEFYGEENADDQVYDKLRSWRRERARRDGKPPYMIASNSQLKMLSAFLPQKQQELAQIPGFGTSRQEQYGEEILKITAAKKPRRSFPLDWISGQVDSEKFRRWIYKRQEERMRAWRERETLRMNLLEGISHGENLNQLEERSSLARRELLLQLEELEQIGYELSDWVEREMAEVPEKVRDTAIKIFDSEGSRYLKPIYEQMDEQGVWNDEEKSQGYEWLRILRLWHRTKTEEEGA